jgi:PKD repeat protein
MRTLRTLLPAATLIATGLLWSGCGQNTQLTPAQGVNHSTSGFQANLLGPDGQPGTALLVQPVVKSGQTVLEVSAPAGVPADGLFVRVAYDPDRYAPIAAQATGAYAAPADSLTLETMQTAGQVDFGQVPLAGATAHPAAGTALLEVLFAPHAYNAPRQVRGVPSSSNSVSPLLWDQANSKLKWFYVNPGDYDQNGIVGVTDLKPLGEHFRQAGPFDFATALSVIDGVPDGEINISDLSPIGVNFGNRIDNYNLYFSTNIADTPQEYSGPSKLPPLDSQPLSAAQGDRQADRLFFTYTVPAGQPDGFYWVRPEAANEEGAPSEGTRSNVNTGSAGSNPPPPNPQPDYNVLPIADMHLTMSGTAVPLDVTLDASGSHDPDGTITTYQWDFEGDGLYDAWSTSPTVTHSYNQPGTYTPTVQVIDNSGGIATFSTPPFTATPTTVSNINPTADIMPTALSGQAPLTVGLLATGSRDVDGVIAKYEWDYDGDGTYDFDSGTDPTVLHTYSTPGVYTATVRVTDNRGGQATDAVQINVGAVVVNQLPMADLQANVTSGNAPLSVNFDGSASADPDGTIVEYAWDLDGDGAYEATSDGPTLSKTYTQAGMYTAKLRVRDNSGATASATVTINVNVVGNQPPTASLTAPTTSGNAPLTVAFDATGSADSDGSLVRYDYDFDSDGVWDAYDASSTVSHTYSSAGNYTAKVRVTDNSGAQAAATLPITVNAVGNQPPTASLSAPTASGNAPLTIAFDATGSSDSDGSIVRYDYDFNNDGIWDAYDSASTLSYTYTKAGNYTAKLRVTDNAGAQATATMAITVSGSGGSGGPTAALTATPQNFSTVPKDVVLDPSGSTAGSAPISRYDWDLDNDGFFDTYSGSPLTLTRHITTQGVYVYKLRVTDTNGQYDETTVTVTASGPPIAVLAVSPGNPVSPNVTITLDASGSSDPGGSITKYEFDKDGNGSYETDNGTNPMTTTSFAGAGDYTVHLRVTDNDNNQTTTSKTIQVRSAIINIADNVGNPGVGASVAIVNGNPALAYKRSTGSDVVYCRATASDGSSWGSPVVVANLSSGAYETHLVVANGKPALTYTDANSHLLYLQADDANGTSWTTGNSITINGNTSYGSSLAIIEGNPAISYGDGSSNSLQYKRATNTDGSAWGSAHTVNSGGTNGGSDSTLADVDGMPAVAFFFWNSTAGVRYRRASAVDGSSWNSAVDISTNGTANNSAEFPSLGVVNGNPAVCYYDRSNTSLRYRRGADADGTSFNGEVVVVSGGDDGNTSKLLYTNGVPYIAYHDANADTLRLIFGGDANGATWGTSSLIDSGPNGAGGYIDMVPISTHLGIACDALGATVDEIHFDYVP